MALILPPSSVFLILLVMVGLVKWDHAHGSDMSILGVKGHILKFDIGHQLVQNQEGSSKIIKMRHWGPPH